MREILFKAKRVDNGEWIVGLFIKDCEIYGYKDEHTYIVTHEHPSSCFGSDIYFEVIPETVGQYTGLTDKNGKKIFEGDIIKDLGKSMDGIPRVVIWNEVWMEFETYLVKSHWAYGTNQSRLWCMRGREIEVISNIHDNPELLEVK